MIDFHTHLLPCVDDGAKNIEESVALLRALAAQGVEIAYATPHFYAERDLPEAFFPRREKAMEQLASATEGLSVPRVLRGAEVAYFPGISNADALWDMRLEGTELLLLEMPMAPWTDYMLGELSAISCTTRLRVLLAHVERYLPFVRMKTLLELRKKGILMQANASALLDLWQAGRVRRLVREGAVQLLASDCHGINRRPPMLDRAYGSLDRRLGDGTAARMIRFGRSLISASYVNNTGGEVAAEKR